MADSNNKTCVVKARVGKRMKKAVTDWASASGEDEAVVLREALAEYFAARHIDVDKIPLSARNGARSTRRT